MENEPRLQPAALPPAVRSSPLVRDANVRAGDPAHPRAAPGDLRKQAADLRRVHAGAWTGAAALACGHSGRRGVRRGDTARRKRTRKGDGIEPDGWKVEGLDRREDCEGLVETARRGDRRDVGCIVLGRGADENKVRGWLEVAASVPGFIGFAVGRTTFWDAMADYEAGDATREEAAVRIAERYREWIAVFERTGGVPDGRTRARVDATGPA